ncbi:MAG: hypothetical protein LBL04_00415, partial [Bacteroidales bacterium]|nr:hypothetical protein [Bacteroidales bacterium]
TVSGGASLTTNATGSDASGIWVEVGDITISTTGIVTANGNGAGSALVIGNDPYKFSISNGTVNLTGNPMNSFTLTVPDITGGTVNIGGTQVYLATITLTGVSSYTVVTAISAPASGYGVQRMLSDMSGKLYFWLPAGNQTITLTAGGKTYSGTVNVTTDNLATATVSVAPTITTTSLPNGTVGAAYSQTLAATGDTPITWSIDSGTLPGGLTLTGDVISGTPTTAGTATFTVKATNGVSPDATKALSITVTAGGVTLPVPVFHGLADEYTAGSPAVPLQVAGTGSESLIVFKVNGTAATELNPATAGIYRVEAASDDGKLRIWKYVQVK